MERKKNSSFSAVDQIIIDFASNSPVRSVLFLRSCDTSEIFVPFAKTISAPSAFNSATLTECSTDQGD